MYNVNFIKGYSMKKSVLVAAFLLVSAFSFNGFAEDKVEEEVTVRELVAEGAATGVQAALMFGYFKYVHNCIEPTDTKTPGAQTFDIAFKGFAAALFGNQAKKFFEKLVAFAKQQTKPLTDPALETIKNVI